MRPRFGDDTNAWGADEVEWFLQEKLAVDFGTQSRLRSVMDEDTHDLVVQLCTRAGMIMEDASVVALTIRSQSLEDLPTALGELEDVGKRILELIRAANALT